MPRLRDSEHALRLATSRSRQPFVCRTCRAQAVRQFHASASRPFIKRIRESLFGSKESKEAERKREEKVQQRIQEQARRDAAKEDLVTRVGNKGRKYKVAAIVDPSINPEYVMSTNWDGLKRIGSAKWIKERADPGEKYVGFMPEKRLTLNDQQWTSLLHHITVEVLALKNANRDVNDICLPRKGKVKPWPETRRTTIVSDDSTGDVSLRFRTTQSQQWILSAIPQVESEAAVSEQPEPEELTGEEEEIGGQETEQQEPEDTGLLREVQGAAAPTKFKQYSNSIPWMTIRLRDPMIKLAIIKRIMQLTGHRIGDPTISSANTLGDLYNTLKTKEPPKRLAKTPEMKRLDANAANVVVHSGRRTPIHKEKEIGRWKIIEDELIARDLPVTGSRWQGAKPRIGIER